MRLKAQVTPFFCMIVVLVLAVLCGTLESARLAGCRLKAAMATDSALSSAFGEYDTALFEQYGILCYPAGAGQLEKRVADYLSYYENPKKRLLQSSSMASPYGISTEQISWEEIRYLLDDQGLAFEEQACQAFGTTILSEAASALLEKWDLAKACSSFLEKVREVQAQAEEILGLEQKYQEIKSLLQLAKEQKEAVQGWWDRLSPLVEQWNQAAAREDISAKTAIEEQAEPLLEQLQASYETWKPFLKQVGTVLQEYAAECEALQQVRNTVEQLLTAGAEALPELFGNILKESGQAVLDYVAEEGQIRKKLADWQTHLEKAIELEEWISADRFFQNASEKENWLSALFTDPAEEKSEAAETDWEESEGMNLLELVNTWKEQGVLTLVASGPFSERLVKGKDLPSQITERSGKENLSPVRMALFQEYLFSCLDSFCDGKAGYDLEYILGDGASDLENMKTTAEKLLLLREGLNLAYLYTDQEKRQAAEGLARAITGAIGLSALYPVAELLTLSAWAFGESVADVRALLVGKEVPFWKSAESWSTSLEGLLEKEAAGQGETEGLSYEAYLRLLLFLKDPVEKRLRAMDVIQWRLQQNDPGFCFSNCIAKVEMKLTYKAAPVFFGRSGMYHMETKTAQAY